MNNEDFPKITSFVNIVEIIKSIKSPRKIQIIGSDGKTYKYLLKGKEDLRVDQRVMKWFTLANSLLHDNKYGVKMDLSIESYPIIPLGKHSGLIAWAEGGDTLFKLINRYIRITNPDCPQEEKELLEEYNLQPTPNKIRTNIQSLEIYRSLKQIYPSDSLREIIWLKSPNSVIWFSQKTNYARSLGLMSIVGYTIGLGERNPQNILYMKRNGKIVHIDFGECFEKSMKRKHWPEKVPFRLTPMLIKGLGVSGVEGIFKMTAQFVMTLLRKNKSTLLSFLNTFVREDKQFNIRYKRVNDKLNGIENNEMELTPEEQVDHLIKEATDEMNLAQMGLGWAPHW
ncbi:PIKK family atypical protein kinase [Histomonas meleagridis]|uniref:PIKK family atypical protein kinase n=1 Tax=Histomonas meleagridis TaxID=135588 RepID=UPI003559FE22|nr:PIKK family atypical protein kinase [Histomonas meleagridis]KAH0805423.1 PIKK family atypical protein kinase [Histomonas meleagridis]